MGAVEALGEDNRGFSGSLDIVGSIFCGCGAVRADRSLCDRSVVDQEAAAELADKG
jgi:hypothetical protein